MTPDDVLAFAALLNPNETLEINGDRQRIEHWTHHADGTRSLMMIAPLI